MGLGSVVILGSFRKHFDGILATIRRFEALGIRVLSPRPGTPIDPRADFVLLDTDETDSPRAVADFVMRQIDKADGVYFYNPGGYMGPSAAFELGYCVARGKAIFAAEAVADALLALYSGRVATPEEVAEILGRGAGGAE